MVGYSAERSAVPWAPFYEAHAFTAADAFDIGVSQLLRHLGIVSQVGQTELQAGAAAIDGKYSHARGAFPAAFAGCFVLIVFFMFGYVGSRLRLGPNGLSYVLV